MDGAQRESHEAIKETGELDEFYNRLQCCKTIVVKNMAKNAFRERLQAI
jgi:hypothetical protein